MITGSKLSTCLTAMLMCTCCVSSQIALGDDSPPSASETDDVSGSATSESNEETSKENDAQSKPSGPGSFEIDEEAATRALERSLIRSDALLLAKGHAEFSLEYHYQFDEILSPILIEFEADGTTPATTGIGSSGVTIASHNISLDFKVGLAFDSQIEFAVPIKAEKAEFSTGFNGTELESFTEKASGTGDVQFSILKTVIREKGRRPDIIARLSVDTDTGAEAKEGVSFGSGGTEYTLGLSATKRQDPLVFNYGISHTIADTVDEIRSGAVTQFHTGVYLAASPYTSLSIAFSQAVVGESSLNGARIKGSDRMLGSFSFGFSSTVGRNWFLSGSLSAGLNESANDYLIALAISKRTTFR